MREERDMSVLVGFIRTPEGRAALERGIEEARIRRTRLVVVHVHDPEGNPQSVADLRQQLEAAGVDHAVESGYRGLDPADDLVHRAEAEDAELIVIGIRRRTAVGKLILGSNAQRVLLDAACPVLAVKAP
jgi:nucleotide-binding universal stress UspA family protein